MISWDQSGWLLKEWGRAAPETAGVPVVQTHRHQGLRPHPEAGGSQHPSLAGLSELKAATGSWHRMTFSHPVGVAGLSSFRTAGRLGRRGRSNRGPCSEWYYTYFFNVFFPFEICNHSGISGHTDIEVLAWQASCHSISQGHHLGARLWSVEQVNGPRILGGFSDWRGVQE